MRHFGRRTASVTLACGGALLVAAPVAQACEANTAMVIIGSSAGPGGSVVTVGGGSFAPSLISLRWDSGPVVASVMGPDLKVSLPAPTTPGYHVLYAADGVGPVANVSVTFEVLQNTPTNQSPAAVPTSQPQLNERPTPPPSPQQAGIQGPAQIASTPELGSGTAVSTRPTLFPLPQAVTAPTVAPVPMPSLPSNNPVLSQSIQMGAKPSGRLSPTSSSEASAVIATPGSSTPTTSIHGLTPLALK